MGRRRDEGTHFRLTRLLAEDIRLSLPVRMRFRTLSSLEAECRFSSESLPRGSGGL